MRLIVLYEGDSIIVFAHHVDNHTEVQCSLLFQTILDQNEVRRFPESYIRVWTLPEKNLLPNIAARFVDWDASYGASIYT